MDTSGSIASLCFGGTSLCYETLCISFPSAITEFSKHPRSSAALPTRPLQDKPPFRIERIPDKGLGMVASRDISQGALIFQERPLLVMMHDIPDDLRLQLEDYLDRMLPDKKAALLGLSNSGVLGDGVLGKIITNAFTLSVPGQVDHLVLYDLISRANHSCTPNAIYSFNRELICGELTCQLPIRAGDEITIRYSDVMQPVADRRAFFQRRYNFTCTCAVCDPSSPTFILSAARRKAIAQLLPQPANYTALRLKGGCDDQYIEDLLELIDLEQLPEQRIGALARFAVFEQDEQRAARLACRAMREMKRLGLQGRSFYWKEMAEISRGGGNALVRTFKEMLTTKRK